MSKELTERFMNDELDDRLYYFTQKMSQDNVEIGRSFAFNMVRADDEEYLDWFLIHEVLAPVPSYKEWQELKELLRECREVLKIVIYGSLNDLNNPRHGVIYLLPKIDKAIGEK